MTTVVVADRENWVAAINAVKDSKPIEPGRQLAGARFDRVFIFDDLIQPDPAIDVEAWYLEFLYCRLKPGGKIYRVKEYEPQGRVFDEAGREVKRSRQGGMVR